MDKEFIQKPFWDASVMYRETVTPCEGINGSTEDIPLLFKPTGKLTVCNYGLQKTYRENADYELTEHGYIRLTPRSSIPVLPLRMYMGESATPYRAGSSYIVDGKTFLPDYQLSVSYEYENTWSSYIPALQEERLKAFYEGLDGGGSARLVFYGDSITVGWNASGLNEPSVNYKTDQPLTAVIGIPPFHPSWARTIWHMFSRRFPSADIQYYNRAAGGSDSGWGVKCLRNQVISCRPDLVFIGFGMNELHLDSACYKNNILAMIHEICAANASCAFVLISPMTANFRILNFPPDKPRQFENVLWEIQKELPGVPVVVAPVYSLTVDVLRRKRYIDITGNNINHPNDFGVSLYTQVIGAVLGCD